MSKETSITKNDNGAWMLINGNAESVEFWEDYEDAKEAMINDDAIQTEADRTNNPDYYYNNSQITWAA